MKYSVVALLGLAGILGLSGCDFNNSSNSCSSNHDGIDINFKGLENLGSEYVYEGWLIVPGKKAVSAGRFHINDNGEAEPKSFAIDEKVLDDAVKYVLTIEPSKNDDPAPSKTHILAGVFDGQRADVTVKDGLGINFNEKTPFKYILATPTDDNDSNDFSGVWWPTGKQGEVPTLPKGWTYEGWAVIDGVPVTTGKFTKLNEKDMSAPFSGELDGPSFPGEDFLKNAPKGVTFPTDLRGKKIVISVEPDPDNSPKPFLLKPYVATVPADAKDHTPYTMPNNTKMPTGTVTRF